MRRVTSGNVGGTVAGSVSGRVGENIRRLAGMFLVEQRRLAAEIDITRQSLYGIYSGRSRPSAETALRIAMAFGIRVDDLYAKPADCLAAALPHLEDAPITVDRELQPGTVTDVVTGEVTPLKKRRA
jgi:DNA-binding XRE family transcriptional regulator